MKRSTIIFIIAILSVVGAILSAYSVWAHYDPNVHEICSISETFNCDAVNKSAYSEILGVPVSILGLGAYAFFFFGILVYGKTKNESLLNMITAGVILGLLFSLYLTSIEAFVLYTWCIVCLGSQLTIILLNGFVFALRRIESTPEPDLKTIHE